MLKQRLLTGLVLIACLLGSLYLLTPLQLMLLFALVFAYAAWEWGNLAGVQTRVGKVFFIVAVVLGFWLSSHYLAITSGSLGEPIHWISAIALVGWVMAFMLVRTYPGSARLWEPVAVRLILGALVLVSAWTCLATILFLPGGKRLLLLVIGVVALADIGAYFAGKRFGRHHLAPLVSPGKTWEGVAGGIVTNLLLFLFLSLLLDLSGYRQLWFATLLLLPSLLSVIGDLFESMLKRARGIKDSGNILPGHGGILDRIDGLVAALPAFVLVLKAGGVGL